MEVNTVGMTDKQFNAFIRFVLDSLEAALDEKDEEKREERLRLVAEHLRDTLED